MHRRFALALLSALLISASASARAEEKTGVIFVAMPGAGKTTAADYLAEKYGLPKFSTGTIVREQIGQPYTIEKDNAAAKFFADRPGELGRRVAERVKAMPSSTVIIEGFRITDDLIAFKKALPGFKVVAIQVGDQRRWDRQLARKRPGEDSVAVLRKRDRREINGNGGPGGARHGLRAVMRMADIVIRPRGDSVQGLHRSLARRVEPHLAHLKK